MNFRPELAEKVLRGEKDVTRRLVSDNPRSPWYRERCGLKVDHTYAVCPGRGKNAVGRVRIVSVRREPVGWLSHDEARREGFGSPMAFAEAFGEINGGYYEDAEVWRVEFAVVPPEDYALWEGPTPTKTPVRQPEAICDTCGAPKGLQVVDEACNGNCGGRVIPNPDLTPEDHRG